MILEPGQAVDRYDVEALLGEGGMAEVYRVRHRTLGSLHALKVLKLEIPGLKERLVQEGQLQATLRHANVVAVTDVVDIAGKPGLVMEFIAGPTLELWLRNHQPTLEEAEALFLGILAGVTRAHRIGLVHRDLKPGNVLLEETDDGFIPKVADFGLAKVLVEQGGSYRTRSGVPMGTPAYMAPEQVRDAANVDQRADIFALGAILYELVAGVPPFDAPDALTIFGRLARGEYTAPEDLVPTLPERFRRAIRGALKIEREDRIPDCASLRALFVGGQELSDVSLPHVVALRGARARTTVVNTLEPAGHKHPSGSDTFVADGVAGSGSAPTMAPASMDMDDATFRAEAEVAEPIPSKLEHSVTAGVAQAVASTRRGPSTWLFGLGALGVFGVVGGTIAVLGIVFVLTKPAPDPRIPLNPKPPPRPIPEVQVAAPGGPDAPVVAPGALVSVPRVTPEDAAPAGLAPVIPAPTVPSPTVPTPAPSPPPTPAPPPEKLTIPVVPPEAAPSTTGRLTITGDADEAWLEQNGVRAGPGELTPGDYQLFGRFGGETLPMGPVRIRVGATTNVTCSAAFKLCRTR